MAHNIFVNYLLCRLQILLAMLLGPRALIGWFHNFLQEKVNQRQALL